MKIDIEVTLHDVKGTKNWYDFWGKVQLLQGWLGENKKITELVDSSLWLEEF